MTIRHLTIFTAVLGLATATVLLQAQGNAKGGAGKGKGAAARTEPVTDTKGIMNAMTIPASNALFNAGLDGEPKDEDWANLRKEAIILGESGNLLLTAGREPVASSSQADWTAAARQMIAASKTALAAIDKKDVDKLTLDGADEILASCEACHSKYFQ
jgi:hypothetical protein